MEATPMKLVGLISTAVLSLTLGAAGPAYAQQEQHDQQEEQKAKPAQDEKKAQPAKPARQDEKNAQQQDKNNKQEEKSAQQQDKNNKQEEKSAQQQDRNNQQEQKNAQQQDRNNKQEEKNAQQQHAQPAQRASGSRNPDDRYRANFGREHSFRVSHNDYDRDRRFQYGGYWFGFVDPWPTNWLYTQDVFVVEIDGMYYLCNPMYPGVNIALSVTL
jgi:outer membrane biosynthesis protein TonB